MAMQSVHDMTVEELKQKIADYKSAIKHNEAKDEQMIASSMKNRLRELEYHYDYVTDPRNDAPIII